VVGGSSGMAAAMTIRSHAVRLLRFAQDVVFPYTCAACGVEGEVLCAACRSSITLSGSGECVFCGDASVGGATCDTCHGAHALDGLTAAAAYHNAVLRASIGRWKYHFQALLGEVLGGYVVRSLTPAFWSLMDRTNAIVIPIPLHPYRLRYRGFNQAEQLARAIGEAYALPVSCDILVRFRLHRSQAHKTHEKRLALKNPFKVLPSDILIGKTVVLVDDVATTGTTLDHAAAVLKQAGSACVWSVTLAKG